MVDEKGFNDFDDFSGDIEQLKFIKESFVPESIEGFFHDICHSAA